MKKIFLPVLVMCFFLLAAEAFPQKKISKTIYQTAPIISLLKGVMNGDATLAEVKKHGNFGLGTVNQVDGELVIYNDTVYQIKKDGKAFIPDGSVKTPFATVIFFHPEKEFNLNDTLNFKRLSEFLDKKIPTRNAIYAIKISGEFKSVQTRSIIKQDSPYTNLNDVLKNQVVFNLGERSGTLVGFRFPEYSGGINAAGYHFHFITNDRKAGGHALDFVTKNVKIEIEYVPNLDVKIPQTEEFYKADLSGE